MKRVIIFGVRGQGINCFLKYEQVYDIIAFADNDVSLAGRELFGKKVILPEEISSEQFDFIIISSQYFFDTIKMQLTDIGISESRISDEYVSRYRRTKDRWDFERSRICNNMIRISGNYSNELYAERWDELKKEYKNIKLFMIYEKYLGEFLMRVFAVLKEEKDEEDTLKVFIPCYYDNFVCNTELVKLLSKKINLIYGEDLLFWQYVLNNKYLEIDLSDFTKYMLRDHLLPIEIEMGEKLVELNDDKLSAARIKKEKWGLLDNEYVCLGTRTRNYLLTAEGSDFHFDFRNSSFYNYQPTIDYLRNLELKSVRMGRNEEIDSSIKNCFDYAGKYADDYMDLVLFAFCKFSIVTTSGMWQLPTMFGKPVLVVNATSFTIACGGIPFTKYDLYIPKKYFDKTREKYLSLEEIINVDRKCRNEGALLESMNIELIENTPEEILDATKEFIMRLEGEWIDDETDMANYRRYELIMNMAYQGESTNLSNLEKLKFNDPIDEVVEKMGYCFSAWENRKGNEGGPIPCRISATYLRNNDFFLE